MTSFFYIFLVITNTNIAVKRQHRRVKNKSAILSSEKHNNKKKPKKKNIASANFKPWVVIIN
jgi:hypothetical protein